MKIDRLLIPLFLLISFCVSAERSYTEEEKVAFTKIWNTGISIALIGVDEYLSDEVKEILAHQTSDRIKDNAYIYLMGLATGSKTPYNTGLNVYQNMLEYKNSEHLGGEPEPRPEELRAPDIDLVCGGDYALCYGLLASKEPPEHSKPSNKFLKSYLALIENQYYQQVPQLQSDNTYMQLTYVTFLQRNFHQVIIQHVLNDKDELLEQLFKEHQTLKTWLITSHQAMSKLIIINLINKNIELLSFLLQKNEIDSVAVKAILKPFTKEQMSLVPVILNQKARNYRMLLSYNQSLLGKAPDVEPVSYIINSVVLKVFSKPHLSLNNDYTYTVKPLKALDELDAKAFKNTHKQFDFKAPDDKIRNTASGIHQLFIDSSPVTYIKIKSAFFELNMKIQLLNAIIEEGSAEKVIEKAQQGYNAFLSHYDNSAPYIKHGKICYVGIDESKDGLSCLNIIN